MRASGLTAADRAKTADAIRAITRSNANGLTSHLTGPLGISARRDLCA